MNESENDEPRAEQSLCWTCEYGMCVRETHQEHLLQIGRGLPPGTPGEDPFGIQGDMPFNNQDGEGEPAEMFIEHDHVRSVCFWRPAWVKDAPPLLSPLLMGYIRQCSQFKKKPTGQVPS